MKTINSYLHLSRKQPTMSRFNVRFCLLNMTIISLTLISTTVFGAPPWSAPVTLSKPAVNAESPAVAISQTGMMAAIWSRQQGSGFNVQAAVNLNGTWTHAVNLASGFEPDIAIDDAGVGMAVWSNGPAVQSSRLLSNGRWSRPITVSETGTVATIPQIVVDSSGNATALWVRYDLNGAPGIETASCPPNGRWSNPTVLASGAPRALNLVVNTAGDVAAIWDLGSFVSSTTVYTSDRPFGGSWSAPYPVAPAAYRQGGGTIGLDASGNLTACWRTNTEIRVADKRAGDAWGPPVTLYTNSSVSDYPLIAKSASGDDMVALIVANFNGGSYNYQIRTSVRPVGGSWTPVEALTSRNEYDTQLHAGTTNGGSFVLTWVDDNTLQVKSSTRTASTAWAPFTVVTAGEFGTDLAVADNTAVAIWLGGSFQAMVSTLTVSP
jgi:hypothetical protein